MGLWSPQPSLNPGLLEQPIDWQSDPIKDLQQDFYQQKGLCRFLKDLSWKQKDFYLRCTRFYGSEMPLAQNIAQTVAITVWCQNLDQWPSKFKTVDHKSFLAFYNQVRSFLDLRRIEPTVSHKLFLVKTLCLNSSHMGEKEFPNIT